MRLAVSCLALLLCVSALTQQSLSAPVARGGDSLDPQAQAAAALDDDLLDEAADDSLFDEFDVDEAEALMQNGMMMDSANVQLKLNGLESLAASPFASSPFHFEADNANAAGADDSSESSTPVALTADISGSGCPAGSFVVAQPIVTNSSSHFSVEYHITFNQFTVTADSGNKYCSVEVIATNLRKGCKFSSTGGVSGSAALEKGTGGRINQAVSTPFIPIKDASQVRMKSAGFPVRGPKKGTFSHALMSVKGKVKKDGAASLLIANALQAEISSNAASGSIKVIAMSAKVAVSC